MLSEHFIHIFSLNLGRLLLVLFYEKLNLEFTDDCLNSCSMSKISNMIFRKNIPSTASVTIPGQDGRLFGAGGR